jgi:hypothetical protein
VSKSIVFLFSIFLLVYLTSDRIFSLFVMNYKGLLFVPKYPWVDLTKEDREVNVRG